MIIKNITLENFRCFQEKTTIALNRNLNIFLGENNVGKSTVFTALQKLKLFAESGYNWYPKEASTQKAIFEKSDWSYEEDSVMTIIVNLHISKEEKIMLLKNLQSDRIDNHLFAEFSHIFNDELTLIFENKYSSNMNQVVVKLGKYFFVGNSFSNCLDSCKAGGYVSRNFDDIFKQSKIANKPTEALLIEFFMEGDNKRILLEKATFYQECIKLFNNNFKLFEDIRVKPETHEMSIKESLNGQHAASVLFNLKNGNPKARDQFEEIKTIFHNHFLDLELAITKENDELNIMISPRVEKKYEHKMLQSGTGIMEYIIILTHTINQTGKVFVFEEPEIHLHPSAQKSLFKLIKSQSINNQIFIITHSENFIDLDKLDNNFVFRQMDGKIKVYQTSTDRLSDLEIKKIHKELCDKNKEIFFSKTIVLVEGQTELLTLPILAEKLGKNIYHSSTFICCTYSKETIKTYQYILDSIHANYIIFCDKDEKELPNNINQHEKKCILDPNFEQVFAKEGLSYLFDEAKKEIKSGSKPLIAKKVAENIDPEKIPIVIKEFIQGLN